MYLPKAVLGGPFPWVALYIYIRIAMHSRLALPSALLLGLTINLTIGLMIGHSAAAQAGGGFSGSSGERPSKIPVIFDTDFGPDYDDVGAIALLHAFADSGYIDILATGASCRHKNVAAALSDFNTYFNRPDLPIGVVSGKAVEIPDRQHWDRFGHREVSSPNPVE